MGGGSSDMAMGQMGGMEQLMGGGMMGGGMEMMGGMGNQLSCSLGGFLC